MNQNLSGQLGTSDKVKAIDTAIDKYQTILNKPEASTVAGNDDNVKQAQTSFTSAREVGNNAVNSPISNVDTTGLGNQVIKPGRT